MVINEPILSVGTIPCLSQTMGSYSANRSDETDHFVVVRVSSPGPVHVDVTAPGPVSVIVEVTNPGADRSCSQVEETIDQSDAMAWFPRDARVVEWSRFSPDTMRNLTRNIMIAGKQLVAMLTCLESLNKRFKHVEAVVLKYITQGFPVVMIGNVSYSDPDEAHLIDKLNQMKKHIGSDKLEHVIARSSIPPSAGRGRWCAIKVAEELLQDIEDSWFVLTDDRRYIDIMFRNSSDTCRNIPTAKIQYGPLLGPDYESETFAQVIRKLLDYEEHSNRAIVALGKSGWRRQASTMESRIKDTRTRCFHLNNLVQVSFWSRLGSRDLVDLVNIDGLRMLSAITAPLGEDYAMTSIALRHGITIEGSAIICKVNAPSSSGSSKTSVARDWTSSQHPGINPVSLKQACLAMCEMGIVEDDDVGQRFTFRNGNKNLLCSFAKVPIKENTQGFDSHYKLMALGILLGLVSLEWNPLEEWVLKEQCAIPIIFSDEEKRQFQHADGKLIIQQIWKSFPLNRVNVKCNGKNLSFPAPRRLGFCGLAEELKKVQVTLETDRLIKKRYRNQDDSDDNTSDAKVPKKM